MAQDDASQSSADTQDSQVIMTTVTNGVPTVSDAATMFKTANPDDKSLFKEGSCQYPRQARGTTPKEIMKIKEKAVVALSLKFRPSSYFVSGRYGEDESEESSYIDRLNL